MQYVERKHIDIEKWDACINAAPNGLIYGYGFYLDTLAKQWDALVYGDYEAVMPLTWNKKYGIKYLYQPPFTQQLGIFSKTEIDQQLIEMFITHTKKHFRFVEIFLNYANADKALQSRPNFILPLNKSYNEIQKSYSSILLKNLKRAANANLRYQTLHNPNPIIDLYKTQYGKRFAHVTNEDYQHFKNLCNQHNGLVMRGVYDENSSLLACALLLKAKDRMYLTQTVTIPQVRSLQPNHFLLDNLVNEFSTSNLILDFEGSAVPGVADFYRSFGAIEEPYYFFRHNKLPWPLRLFK